MKRRSREINIFSISALDLFASALGAFILMSLVFMVFFAMTARDAGARSGRSCAPAPQCPEATAPTPVECPAPSPATAEALAADGRQTSPPAKRSWPEPGPSVEALAAYCRAVETQGRRTAAKP